MELDNRDFFTDPIFKLSNKDLKPLSNSYFGQHKGIQSGWYKQNVLDLVDKDPSLFDLLKDNGFVKDNKINWPSYKVNDLGFRSEDSRRNKSSKYLYHAHGSISYNSFLYIFITTIQQKKYT